MVKNPPASIGDLGSIPRSGRSPGGGNGNPLQYSCLETPMNRGAWRATVHRIAESGTTEHTHTHTHTRTHWNLKCETRVDLMVCQKMGMGSFCCYNVAHETHTQSIPRVCWHWLREPPCWGPRGPLATAARKSWHRCHVNISIKAGCSHTQGSNYRIKKKNY